MHVRTLSLGFVIAWTLTGASLFGQAAEGTANPELVGALAKGLGSSPQQAEGAAGALFDLARTRLSPADWAKVAGSVPGMDGLLKAAPAVSPGATGTSGLSGLAGLSGGALPGNLPGGAGLGGLSGVAASFTKLGLTPDMVLKAVPILTGFVSKVGGPAIGQLLGGVLK